VKGYVAYIAAAGGALVVASVILFVIAIVSGNSNGAERITFSDFGGGLFGLGEIDNRFFFATCAPGRLTVEFRPDEEIRITRDQGGLIASLDTKDASVGCSGGALEDPRGRGFYVRGLTRVTRPTKLECVTQRSIQLVVHPIFRYESDVYGGSVVLGTPVRNLPPRALIISAFTEDGRSDVYYRSPGCRITEG
jgi:hypothetical protein